MTIEYAATIEGEASRTAAMYEYKRFEAFRKSHKACQKCGRTATIITRSVGKGGEQMHAYCERCKELESAKDRLRRMLAE